MCEDSRYEAKTSTIVCEIPDQSSSHAAIAECQFGKVPNACSRYQRSMQLQWNNTDSHGLKPVKIFSSAGLNMKEVTLFKRHLGWTVKETVE
jgi:hypothetical protein